MRKPTNKIDLVSEKAKTSLPVQVTEMKNPVFDKNINLPNANSQIQNPMIISDIINGVINISNGLVELGIKIQETKQIKEQTKQIKYQSEVIIAEEIEATNRMRIDLEKETIQLKTEFKKYKLDTELSIAEKELNHELNMKTLDIEYLKFKDKMQGYSIFLNKVLDNYDKLEVQFMDEPELRTLILDEKKSIHDNIIKVLVLITQVER